MRARGCAFEESVVAAVRTHAWNDALRAHVAACPTCSEVSFIGEALLHDARQEAVEEPLPDPARIWLEARLRSRRLQVARATRPIKVVRWIAWAVAVAVATICLAWLEPHVGRWLAWLRPPTLDVLSGFAFLHGIVVVIASCAFVVFAGYALVTTRRES